MQHLLSRRALVWLALAGAVTLPAAAQEQKKPKKERNRISREELLEAADKLPDLYAAVRSLRPHFLEANNRGSRATGVGERVASTDGVNRNSAGSYGTGGSMGSEAIAVVYLDGRRSGEPDYLKGLATKDIEEVRYLTANEAGMEYGLGHEGGAIVVKMFVEKKP